MRILHVTDGYLPTIGGIELHVRDLADRQRAAGHDVEVATTTPGDPERGIRRVRGSGRHWLSDVTAGIRPDVVHAHVSIVSPFALATARRTALRGLPTAVTVHSLWTHVGPLPQLARTLWSMRSWDVTWSAVSDRAARPVRDLLDRDVHVVPNAVDLSGWAPFPDLPDDSTPHVLSVMRLTKVKRALPLVRTFARIATDVDFTATVIGDGPERPAVEGYLRRHQLLDRVTLAGVQDREEIRAAMRRASVFVAPAHRESFGIAALEARASGVPVVASSRSGVPTFIEHGRDGLLGQDDRAIGDHLLTLLRDHAARDQIAWHNRAVRPELGWDDALDNNDALYRAAGASVSRPQPLVDAR